MAGEHTIYLSSGGNMDLFPENKSSKFTNRLSTPILLDSNSSYEVGLVSILYPDKYYGILANNSAYDINIYTYMEGKAGKKELIRKLNVQIQKNILAGNIKKIVNLVNKNLLIHLKEYYYEFYQYLFPYDKILSWDEDEDKVEIHFHQVEDQDFEKVGDIQNIYIQMNYGLANILGFRSDTEYTIFDKYYSNDSRTLSYHPPSPTCGVEYIYLYTDIIQPTNFAGQLVNILDCFTLNNGGNKGIHNTVYKSLNTQLLDQISIVITDQKGRPIHFTEDSTLTLLLHIKSK